MNKSNVDIIYEEYKKYDLLDDRREYDIDSLISSNPGLSEREAVELYSKIQKNFYETDEVNNMINRYYKYL